MYENVVQPVQELTKASRIYPGGLCDVFFTPIENVLTWPVINPLTGGIDDDIELKEGAVLFAAEFNTPTQKYEEETKEATPGHFHDMIISATLPGNVNENILALGTMKYHRFLVVFKEKDGTYRFLGNEDSGAKISYKYSSGDLTSSRNRDIKITWSSQNPAPIYQGSLTTVPVPITGGSFMFIEAFKVKAGQPIEPGESTYTSALIENKKVFILINEQKVLSTDVNDMIAGADRYISKVLEDDNFTLVDADGNAVPLIENDNVEIYAHD